MRIMITGGGTGGHTSPAVAILEELRRRDPQLLLQWVGRRGGIEERVSGAQGIPFRALPVEGWPRSRSVRRLWVAVKLALSVFRAALLIRKFRPQVAVGVGGYVSLPLLWAAQRMGIPTVLHEQNKRMGMANRLLAPRATRLFVSYEETSGAYPRDKAQLVGNPVRAGFASPPEPEAARLALGLDPDLPVVLVSGGSQGAQSINGAVAEALASFPAASVQILWMVGKAGMAAAREAAGEAPVHVEVFAFIEDMVTACAAADVLVGRSGASSTAEIAMLGRPSILIPYPHATDNHQEENARAFEEVGAAVLLHDADCDGERLGVVLRELLDDSDRRERMGQAALSLAKPLAAESVAEEIVLLVHGEASA